MEKRDLYFILAVTIIFVLAFSTYQLTGNASIGFCTETDDRLDYNITGTAKFENRDKIYTDYCFSELKVKEYYCLTELNLKTKIYQCPNGCQNGACVI
tara:strand:- start:1908 stop:2201 length:294 start_codon:yes stop_codon:yes gene_type:complete